MISILIPAYNFNITSLVKELHKQAIESCVDFEIIVMEDGSTQYLAENKTIIGLSNCQYIALDKNIGRSAIRNRLADKARYEHILFLDCDAALFSPYFVEKYISFCKEECVVLGGRVYPNELQNPTNYSLIVNYGKSRERNDRTNLSNRKNFPMFTTPNFLISKSIFNKIRFDESIIGYGHEDTAFGIMLHRLQVDFIYIDNPVIHIGLEPNEIYLQKNEMALLNLLTLYKTGKYPELANESKLLRYYLQVNKLHLASTVGFCFNWLKQPLKSQLSSAKPSMLLFDVYKLLFLCNATSEK